MMKIKSILLPVAAMLALVGCSSNEGTGPANPSDDVGKAYISINVQTPYIQGSRSSSENTGATPLETDIKVLYVVTFDANDKIITYGNNAPASRKIDVTTVGYTGTKPKAFEVSSNAKGMLLIANPGTLLEGVLTSANVGDGFEAFNRAITGATVAEITDPQNTGKGFTMINRGNKLVANDKDMTPNAELCLVDIAGKMTVVSDDGFKTAADAQAEAEKDANRVTVDIERLSGKIEVLEKSGGAATSGKFTFTGWVLDAVNTTFYPWAKKVDTGTSVGGSPSFNIKNFYTIDPNYTGNAGIEYNTLTNYAPDVTWLNDGDIAYSIENTERADEQRFKNATRIVIKSVYYPDPAWTGDWFQYADDNYENFAALQAAYAVETNLNLRAACEKLFAKLKTAYSGSDVDFSTKTTFGDLTPAEFDKVSEEITDGGELAKENNCIRWYQGGLNYYWYEIRHDDGVTGANKFAKYGVVRNNWYELTLTKVDNSGTPWYPEILNPGPGDPDPDDQIDEMEGYLAVSIRVMPWVKWGHEIEL